MNKLKNLLKKIIPSWVFSIYHWKLALLGALIYRFPARHIKVVAVTGTKGKSSTTELVSTILEEAGYKTALVSTVRFKIGNKSQPNRLKMTTPGRFTLQKLIREAVDARCDYIVLEISSEATKQFRHKFIAFDALLVTNLSPEHIESHGSFAKYKAAKLKIAQALENSSKPNKVLITNGDDPALDDFRKINIATKIATHLADANPHALLVDGLFFTYASQKIQTKLVGEFNLYNILLAIAYVKSQNIGIDKIKSAMEKFSGIPGRLELVTPTDPSLIRLQDFKVIVDYAHTADSLQKVYEIYKDHQIIAVLGGTGGGRDTDRRQIMGGLADKYASFVYITDEDPYDDDPREIAEQVASGVLHAPKEIEMDRRVAIRKAVAKAETGSVIIITGKGTDPYIMRANGAKESWSDAEVARIELTSFLQQKKKTNEQV
ncbi:MAG: UDP-N-acetylmuramyl-tripeptide synthetase [Patescibacteria group bacterium]